MPSQAPRRRSSSCSVIILRAHRQCKAGGIVSLLSVHNELTRMRWGSLLGQVLVALAILGVCRAASALKRVLPAHCACL